MTSTLRARLWTYLKPVTDGLLVILAFVIAYLIRYRLQWFKAVEPAFFVPFRVYAPSVVLLTAIVLLAFWVEGAYGPKRRRTLGDALIVAFKGTVISIAVMTIVVFYARPGYYSRLIFGYTGVLVLILISASRAIEAAIIEARYRRGLGVTRLLIVGAGENARAIMRALVARPDLGYQVVGFVDDDPVKAQTDIGRYTALGTLDQLDHIMTTHQADEVIITLPWVSYDRIVQVMSRCQRDRIRVRVVPDLFQMTLRNVVVEEINGVPLLGLAAPALREWELVLKRICDVVISLLLLLILAPAMGLIALAIVIDSPGPVLFKQKRVGRAGEEFVIYKFRTMCVGAEGMQQTLASQNEASGPLFKMRDDPRRTRVGKVLRHGLDELPQFLNVLKGEMSLVGPRPPVPSEVEQYESWHRKRLDVRPGITGLWQVSGRSDLPFDEMVLLDLYYIENWSPLLDMRILLRTVPVVLVGKGGY